MIVNTSPGGGLLYPFRKSYNDVGIGSGKPAPADMLNDAFLGLAVVALGLIIWLVWLLIKDPRGVARAALIRRKA